MLEAVILAAFVPLIRSLFVFQLHKSVQQFYEDPWRIKATRNTNKEYVP